MLRIAFLVLALVVCPTISCGQTSTDFDAVDYFPDKLPANRDLSRVPSKARDVIVAKVRLIGSVFSPNGRHPWDPPQTKDRAGAEVEIVQAYGGNTRPGARYIVYFGPRDSGALNLKYPHTPRMRTLEYFIVAYLEDDGKHRLLGFPVSSEAYEQWDKEVWEYERLRGLPGAVDK
jgi:hypothetical protein